MQDLEYGFPRIPPLGSSVDRGHKLLVDTLAGRETATSRPTWASGRGLPSNRFGGSVYGYEDGFPLTGGGLSHAFTLPAARPGASSRG
jgi:hypothetical protein